MSAALGKANQAFVGYALTTRDVKALEVRAVVRQGVDRDIGDMVCKGPFIEWRCYRDIERVQVMAVVDEGNKARVCQLATSRQG